MLSDISFPAHIQSENETQTASPTQPGNTIHEVSLTWLPPAERAARLHQGSARQKGQVCGSIGLIVAAR